MTTYSIEWSRPDDPEHYTCSGLDQRTLIARLISGARVNGYIIVHRVTRERR